MLINTKYVQLAAGALLLGGALLINGCRKTDEGAPKSDENSTFAIIQRDILTPTCATSGCHASQNDGGYRQHQLVLEKSVAYASLVNAAPKNSNALKDGLLRVKPGKPDQSLLYHKLLQTPLHHASDYGNPMPLGGRLLTTGQIEFIRKWIEAGAPLEGSVVDAKVLQDTSRLKPEEFTALVPPATGKGIQLNVSPFQVSPNFEREIFVYKKLDNPAPLYVNRVQMKMRPNSHHLLIYQFAKDIPAHLVPAYDEVRDLRNPSGALNFNTLQVMGYQKYLFGSQTSLFEYSFPEGMALMLPANMAVDVNSHYVNKTNSSLWGEISVNFYTVDPATVKQTLTTLDLANTDISLPPGQRTIIKKDFLFKKRTHIVALTSHTHERGEKFIIRIKGGTRNGEIVYTSTDWHHPEVTRFDTPLVLNAGEGLTSEVTYNNTTNRTINFGLTSEDEMDIIFGYYYE